MQTVCPFSFQLVSSQLSEKMTVKNLCHLQHISKTWFNSITIMTREFIGGSILLGCRERELLGEGGVHRPTGWH